MLIPTVDVISSAHLPKLLRLASPALPVGGYSYSQALEWAVESGTVRDISTAEAWIADALMFAMGSFEAPLVWRLHHAWCSGDVTQVKFWNERFLAARETRELRAESVQMGFSFKGLLQGLGELEPVWQEALAGLEEPAYPSVFSLAAAAWGITAEPMLIGYLWSWVENQVLVALKTIPLGQLAGQKILSSLLQSLPRVVERATAMKDDELSNFVPALAIASSLHETQYSRLFRS